MGFFKDNKKEIALVAGSGLVAGGAVGAGLYLTGTVALPSLTTTVFALSAGVVTATGFGLIALAVVATVVGIALFLRRRYQKSGFDKPNPDVSSSSDGLTVREGDDDNQDGFATAPAPQGGGSQAARHPGPGLFDTVSDAKDPVSHDFPKSLIKGWIEELNAKGTDGQHTMISGGYEVMLSKEDDGIHIFAVPLETRMHDLPLLKPFVVNDKGDEADEADKDGFESVSLGGD